MIRFIEVTTINSEGFEQPMLCNVAHIITVYPTTRPSPRHNVKAALTLAEFDDPVCVKESYLSVRAAMTT